jgi:type IV secretory pathway TrbD component
MIVDLNRTRNSRAGLLLFGSSRRIALMSSVRAAITFLVVTVWTIIAAQAREAAAPLSAQRSQPEVADVLGLDAETPLSCEDGRDSDASASPAVACFCWWQSCFMRAGGVAAIDRFSSRLDARLLQFESLFVRAP